MNGRGDYRINISSVNIPILVRLAIPAGKWVSPFVELGANYKIITKTHVESRSVFCGFASCNEFSYDGDLEKSSGSSANLLIGIGAAFRWGNITIPLSARLSQGLGTYTLRGEFFPGVSSTIEDLKTRTLQIVTGISF